MDLGKIRVGWMCVLEGNFKDLEWNEIFSIFCVYIVFYLVVFIKDVVVVGIVVIG